jgi:hypothetical protein
LAALLTGLVILVDLGHLALAGEPAQVVGTVRSARGQSRTCTVSPRGNVPLRPGDIVQITRKGKRVNGGTVTEADTSSATIRLYSAGKVQEGDEVVLVKAAGGTLEGRVGAQTPRAPAPAPEAAYTPRPRLEVTRSSMYVANTGFIRIKAQVTNRGDAASSPTLLYCRWVTFDEKVVREESWAVPALNPGETSQVECFSLLRADRNVLTTLSDTVEAEGYGRVKPRLSLASP